MLHADKGADQPAHLCSLISTFLFAARKVSKLNMLHVKFQYSILSVIRPIYDAYYLFFPLSSADIVFIVKDKPHARFRREGINLVHTANVPLGKALTGTTVEIFTLDERTVYIPINDIIK